MKTNFGSKKQESHGEYTFYFPGRWVSYITLAIAESITNAVVAAITVVVTILVLLGGLWLAYFYLPVNIFFIILAVIIADVLLCIALRATIWCR